MNQTSTKAARFALTAVALASACLWGSNAAALGLGRLAVQSALGESLKAEIDITSMTPEEASSLKLRVAPPEAYRAAGVEYNAALANAQVQVVRRPDGRQVLRVTSDRAVLEPFVDVIIEASWASGRLVREYTMLFDPPVTRQAAAPATEPTVAPAAPAPAPAPAVAQPPAVATAPAPSRASATRPAPVAPRVATLPAAPAAPAGADEYRVRPGDTLSRIAGKTQRPGVSLDQMLVSLFRANPQAFLSDNMNRLKSGTVLSVPSADEVGKLAPKEARDVIIAQSNDFAAYRQRLASGVTTTAQTAPPRQAAGKVQAQVDDRKQSAAATQDRLKLSQGGVKASAPEAKASKAAESKDASTRLAELSRNVDELKKLQGAATPAPTPAAPAAPPASAAAAKPAPAPAPAPAVAAAPAPAPAVAPAPVAAPSAAASSPMPAPTVVAATPPAAAASKPIAAAPPVTGVSEPGMLDSLLDNSLLLPAAGVLVALLGGLGLYRLRGRMRKPAGETSFLESRLQPDSFFGASGGQRVDTHEASTSTTGSSSSMSYSLSQLDAIGDVDPVAEADVYLAYGRDLQAEEILKEAMRANPERMAIRSKLLEVYAKRRDTKGFELLATQMLTLTRGEGEDWPKAQALGLTIDPENPLYKPGATPEGGSGGKDAPVEVLGAPTQPYTAPVAPPAFQPAADATLDDGSLDLDLELPLPPPTAAIEPTMSLGENTQPFATTAANPRNDTLDFSLDEINPKTIPVPPARPEAVAPTVALPPRERVGEGLDFDLGDLGGEAPASQPAAATEPKLDFGEFGLDTGTPEPPISPDHDPLARKIELAEEFRQIGDMEGARDLLEEVIAKAEGALKSKAQGMLDRLG
ncbi:MAG: LysM peptidoglycan-binding domain-containing protein [Rubrivivax sp.]|nr:LysM peptidoglycan-binding domain-containing protein [Rubrivivax sp.]